MQRLLSSSTNSLPQSHLTNTHLLPLAFLATSLITVIFLIFSPTETLDDLLFDPAHFLHDFDCPLKRERVSTSLLAPHEHFAETAHLFSPVEDLICFGESTTVQSPNLSPTKIGGVKMLGIVPSASWDDQEPGAGTRWLA